MSRDREWQTHLGHTVSIQGCTDEHLANTIQWLVKYNHPDEGMLRELRDEAKRRDLTEGFLSRAPFPYKDGLGNFLVWNYEAHEPMVVGTYTRG